MCRTSAATRPSLRNLSVTTPRRSLRNKANGRLADGRRVLIFPVSGTTQDREKCPHDTQINPKFKPRPLTGSLAS
jgi:hypothetical protein